MRGMQPKNQLQLLHSELPANLFSLLLKGPAKANGALLEVLLHQAHQRQRGPYMFHPGRLHPLQLLLPAYYRERKRCCPLLHHKNLLRTVCGAPPKSCELVVICCSNASSTRGVLLPASLFCFFLKKLFFYLVLIFWFILHVLLFSIWISSFCGFILCTCEDTTQLKFGGVVCVSKCMCLCLCCVKLCYLIFVYGFEKPNEDKLSVIQYLWECQVWIVIDGGWNSVPTLRLWLNFMRML